MIQLSIVIVNYKSASLILDCLRSFVGKMNIGYELFVVDNDSRDDSETRICSEFPSVKWLQMGYNAGFARANNAAIRISKGDAVLLLNPDTIIIDNAIEHCYRQFMDSGYVACGVQLLNEDDSPQISGNFAMKGGLNYLLPLPYIGNGLKFVAEQLKVKKPNVPEAQSLIEVDWINGAFLMAKKETIDKAGLLDEDFFLYAEEAEWCSRLKKQGKLCVFGNLKTYHLQGETANETFAAEGKGYYNLYDKKGLQIILSNMVRIRKEFGLFWFFVLLFFYTIEIPVLWIFGFFENLFRLKNPLGHAKKAGGFTKNIAMLWTYVFLIVRNKPHFYKVL